MKILILSNNFTGLFSFRKEVVAAIKEAGYDIVISAPFDEKASYFGDMGCTLIDTQFNRKGINPLKDFALMLRYRRILKEQKPVIVLSYTIKPNLYGGMACQLCGVPQIVNITGLGSAVENPGWLQKLTIFLYKLGLRKTHTVFFQNRANKDFCESHNMVKGKRLLIPGSGVNLQYHKYQEYPEENPIRFNFVGRLLWEKGIDEFLAAAEQIKTKYPNTEFHIIGSCEEAYSDRVNQLHNDGIVIYHGPQKDVRPFVGAAHCTIHPSFYPEGMSNVLLESCAAGRPIITTDRPGCGEIVEDGRNGYLVKAKDVKGLVNVIERFIQLPHTQKILMGINARKKVEKDFDRQIVVDAYLNEIHTILSEK